MRLRATKVAPGYPTDCGGRSSDSPVSALPLCLAVKWLGRGWRPSKLALHPLQRHRKQGLYLSRAGFTHFM